jgi:methylase of polypeptide subunit release factors
MTGIAPLPDVERVLSLPAAEVAAFGARLRSVGFGPAIAARLARVGERLDDALRAPMRIWHARRMLEPAAVAARMFVLHDPVAPDEARAAIGDLGPLVDAGVVDEQPEGVVSRLHAAIAGDVLCFGDRPGLGGGAVPPICGGTMQLVRAVTPKEALGQALDLGCGAGAVALFLARASRRVVATDIDRRALAWTRFNAALNGVANVELREGDLYEAVRGERFDRVAVHPPFLARPDGVAGSTFAHGGSRGDELPLRVLAGVGHHLSPAGRAVVLGDWPVVEGDPLDLRVRQAVGVGSLDLLVLQAPSKNLDEYCVQHAAVEHRELGDSFARAAIAHRDHLEHLGLRGLAFACVVVSPGSGWTSLVSVRHPHDAPIGSEAIDRILSARNLALGPSEALAAARLHFPPGSRLVEQAFPDGGPPAVVVQLPAGRPEWPPVLDGVLAARLARVVEAPRVSDAITDSALEAAREGLLRGALEPAGG